MEFGGRFGRDRNPMKFQPATLQQRAFFFILLPVCIFLLVISSMGFVVLREILTTQWGLVSLSSLQQTAHYLDTQLGEPKKLVLQLPSKKAEFVDRMVFLHVVEKLRELDLVIDVYLTPLPGNERGRARGVSKTKVAAEDPLLDSPFKISIPRYHTDLSDRAVSLVAELRREDGKVAGEMEIVISFDVLMARLMEAPWWTNYKAYLLDGEGNVLANTGDELGLADYYPGRIFGSQSELEGLTLAAIEESSSGTVIGPGRPPSEVSGFHKLEEAPWTMVVIAPGREVLASLIRFRLLYLAAGAVSIFVILFLLRRLLLRAARRIKQVSAAAENLAKGRFGPPLEAYGRDEIAELITNFNKMSLQLQQRLALKEAIDLAREVQQGLLPEESLKAEGVEVCGRSIYCDETGGDFFDILRCERRGGKIIVVVGDVVGHGIGAALLMASVRSLLRCRLTLPGSPEEIVSDINSLLTRDTERSGSFVTLFYLEVDPHKKEFCWVRAGHEPALVYSYLRDNFVELKGAGLALGIDPDYRYSCGTASFADSAKLIMLGTDGVWETENSHGQQFGRARVKKILAARKKRPVREIVDGLVNELDGFAGGVARQDDTTLAILKLGVSPAGRDS